MPIPALTDEHLKMRAEQIQSADMKKKREMDLIRFQMHEGAIRNVVEAAIRQEYTRDETIRELVNRLVPINIVHKIIDKLANVYTENPIRRAQDGNESDNELIEDLEEIMALNQRQKEANHYFKLFKRNLQEIVLNHEGYPSIRNLPRHTYEVFSSYVTSPEVPSEVYKWIVMDTDAEKQVIAVWTEFEHVIINGKGQRLKGMMEEMNNPEGVNPYGVLPFVYNNSSSQSVNPIQDDDLIKMAVLINLIASDLAFASKYNIFSVVALIGAGGDGNLNFSPNSVISLDRDEQGNRPEIEVIKPQVDMPETIGYIEFLLSALMASKNLSTSGLSGSLNTNGSTVSGVAKAIDLAESMEDIKDQQEFFRTAEIELFDKLAFNMMPWWQANQMLHPDLIGRAFSSNFMLSIIFREPRVIMSEKEQIEISKMLLDNGFTTKKRELRKLNPKFTDDELNELIRDIEEDQERMMQNQIDALAQEAEDGEQG